MPDSECCFEGMAGDKFLRIRQDGTSLFLETTREDFDSFWRSYFDLDTDYGAIRKKLACDPTLCTAEQYAPGLRILKQPEWETLASFILSQNNNIRRISRLVGTLCENFGERITCPDGKCRFAFPTPERLAPLAAEDLAPLRAGYRAPYLLDAARKTAAGEIDFELVRHAPIGEARAELLKIKGVGVKVADCALLYGFGRTEAFPADVWIKRALDRFYGGSFPEAAKGYEGIAQLYLFHYIRTSEENTSAKP